MPPECGTTIDSTYFAYFLIEFCITYKIVLSIFALTSKMSSRRAVANSSLVICEREKKTLFNEIHNVTFHEIHAYCEILSIIISHNRIAVTYGEVFLSFKDLYPVQYRPITVTINSPFHHLVHILEFPLRSISICEFYIVKITL